ncbi:MAG: hypothetical protein HKL87_00850 [Acidimicrobiaceae bacterium]|nr:hypothetical protein [Acidimicrobiaceae bacterium]
MSENDSTTGDLRQKLKSFAQPLVDSVDARLRDQVDSRVDERVRETMSDRLSVIERAIADLDRRVRDLETRLDQSR